jgi:hypothetical protein
MPQRVACNGCGHVLYEGRKLKSPDEIIHEYNGKCPECERELSLFPIDVNVTPLYPDNKPKSKPVSTKKTEEQPYKKIEYTQPKIDFTVIACNAINAIIDRFGLYKDVDTPPISYDLLSKIEKIGCVRPIPKLTSPISRIKLPLDTDCYSDANSVLEIIFLRSHAHCAYYLERTKHPFAWAKIEPNSLPSELRYKYQGTIFKKFEKLVKIFESKP